MTEGSKPRASFLPISSALKLRSQYGFLFFDPLQPKRANSIERISLCCTAILDQLPCLRSQRLVTLSRRIEIRETQSVAIRTIMLTRVGRGSTKAAYCSKAKYHVREAPVSDTVSETLTLTRSTYRNLTTNLQVIG